MNTLANEILVTTKPRNEAQPAKSSSEDLKHAMDNFLEFPSFDTKQMALESFLEQLIIGEISISTPES